MNSPSFALRRLLAASALLVAASQALADFAGTSAGIFANPAGPGGMVTTGNGTSNFSWGDSTGFATPPSSLSLTGTAFSTPAETLFLVGTLSYYNGTIAGGTEANTVDLLLTLSFTSPAGINKNFAYNLALTNVANGVDPVASADYVTLPSVANTTFTDGIDIYTLHLEFGAFSGSSFGGPNEFRVLEGQRASVEILGKITTDLAGVPDGGSTLALLGLALVSIGLVRRKLAA